MNVKEKKTNVRIVSGFFFIIIIILYSHWKSREIVQIKYRRTEIPLFWIGTLWSIRKNYFHLPIERRESNDELLISLNNRKIITIVKIFDIESTILLYIKPLPEWP